MGKDHIHIAESDLRRLKHKLETGSSNSSVKTEEKEVLNKIRDCTYCLVTFIMVGMSSN